MLAHIDWSDLHYMLVVTDIARTNPAHTEPLGDQMSSGCEVDLSYTLFDPRSWLPKEDMAVRYSDTAMGIIQK